MQKEQNEKVNTTELLLSARTRAKCHEPVIVEEPSGTSSRDPTLVTKLAPIRDLLGTVRDLAGRKTILFPDRIDHPRCNWAVLLVRPGYLFFA